MTFNNMHSTYLLIGVALSTLGPGATNFTTSAAFAYLGGFPCLFLTGQKPIKDSKQANFQIIDVVEMMKPITKYTKSIPGGNMLAASVRRAFAAACTEKGGPVHIELPEDVASEMTSKRVFEKLTMRRPIAEQKAITTAVDMLMAAQRPVMIVGAAANRQRAVRVLRKFVEETGMYWCSTQMGKGVLDERQQGFLGCTALSDHDFVHGALNMADVILMIGHDESEKPPIIMHPGGTRKVIHVSFTPAIVDNVYSPSAQVIGDIANAVWQIHEGLRQKTWDQPVFRRYKELARKALEEGMGDEAFPMNIARVVADFRRVLPDDGILSLDNGLYKVIVARLFKAYQPNTVLLDNALATMGAGVPNSIACKMLYPDRKTVSISGDGGFMMNEAELATCVQYDLDVVHVILNDSAFGMIKWKQEAAGFEDYGLDLQDPDFVALANSYGAHGHRIAQANEFAPLLEKCLNSKGTHVIEVPFSYEWMSAKLKETERESREIVRLVEKEFGACLIDCSREDHDVPSAKLEAPSAPVAAPVKQIHEAAPPAKEAPEAKRRKVVTSSEDYLVKKGSSLPFYLGGMAAKPNADLSVVNKYNGEEFCKVALAGESHVNQATEIAASVGAKKMRELPAYVRQRILQNVVDEATRRRDEFGYYLAIEAGKPIKDARGEADRLIQTFQLAAEESTRIYGEYADLAIAPRAEGYSSVTKRVPIGPVSLISPFNFPLNLAAHKVAPAIAAGCPFVLKPASSTPLGALLIGDILANDPNMPREGFSILPCSRAAGNLLTTDNRYKLMSFTGSPGVGFALKNQSGKKPTVLELGGNAACVIDDLDVGLSQLVDEVVHGAFYQSGQSCISVQRLFVRDTVYNTFRDAFVAKVETLKAGDPLDEDTFIGPVISEKEAKRVESWIQEAVDAGATLLCGGKRFDRVFVSPAVVENVPHNAQLYAEEVFGPAVCMEKFSDFKEAVAEVNNSKFGLQAGVYTNNWNRAHYAFEEIDAGGVCINSTPSVRIDSQAYGGVKDSGIGREGIKYAIEDYTELKVMVMKNAGKF